MALVLVPPAVRDLKYVKLGPYPKWALPFKVTLPRPVTFVLALLNSVMLPPASFGYPKQITDSCFIRNYRHSYGLAE